ncbi:MAG TPA: ankyrin repeat domain-containing protein [Bryobacteraceae bacterium]|nr:ankyrin repeat domain-containing protein [Bryobacteraceae bacterium]
MNLEQQKKQARELLRAVRAGQADALARLRERHRRWAAVDDVTVRQEAALHDAQFVVAREQGFSSWTKLKMYAEGTRERHTRLFVADVQWIAERVQGLLRTRRSAGPAALEQIREWHPRFSSSSDDEICRAPFTEADARLVYAREHGFECWDDLAERVNLLASSPDAVAGEPFLAAFRALEAGDVATLKALLRDHPRMVQERGTNGNSLLNLAVSIAAKGGVGPEQVEALLAAGADVNDANDRGWTPLHQAAYSNQCAMAEALIKSGADLEAEAHGSGGTPLVAALFWGHREVADMLGRHSTAPGNLRVAAGLGNEELLEKCFSGEKKLTPEACAARGFYRPHSGFPDWRPSTDLQEVLDEALVWAAKSGRTEVLARLVRAGARLDADPYRGTPLIWAAVRNHMETAEWLIDHGAAVDRRATFGGATHGQGVTALHLAAQSGHLAMVQLLVRRGADPRIKDELYHCDAEGWANHFGQIAVADYLRSLGRNTL